MINFDKTKNDLALLDEEFLSKLYEQEYHEKYARITSLTFDEMPVAQIEGRVTSGSVNIDGNSNVRRTFNLTLAAQNIDINDYYWGIKTKVKLEVGLKNSLPDKEKYSQYPEIIWFKQGTFIITTFNTSVATNGYTINISGKDKMCLLNGDLGGQLFASIDFGAEETIRKVFRKAILTDTSSETIMAGDYYFIPNYDTDWPDVVSSKNKLYAFQPIDIEAPFYIKEGSNYKLIRPGDDYVGNLQKYRPYKKVMSPSEVFYIKPPDEPQKEPWETPVDNPTNNDSLTDDPEPSKPPEEPYVKEEDPEQPQEERPYKSKRKTGIYPTEFTAKPIEGYAYVYEEESEAPDAEILDIYRTAIERHIGETWAWRTGNADVPYPKGGYMSRLAAERAKENGGN